MSDQNQLSFAIRAQNEATAALKSVQGDIDRVKEASEKGHGALGKMGGALADVGKIASGFVIGQGLLKAPGFLMDAAKAAMADEQATAKLQQTFKNYANMVGAAPDTFARLNGLLDQRIQLGQKLAFTDDDMRDSFNALLTATDDSTEATKRQSAAMDLARGANIPLATATKMLGKINEENVEVFKKLGITLGENATEADALAAVQARFGGQAEAYAKSTAGQFEQTQIRMGELKEQIGAQLLPVMTKIGTVLIEDVVPKLEQFANYWSTNISPKIQDFWENKAKPVLKALAEYIETVVMPAVKENFAKFQVYYESDIRPALENIKTAIRKVVEFLIEHWGQIEPFVRPIFIAIEAAAKVALGAIKIAIDILGGDWDGAWVHMQETAQAVANAVVKIFDAVKDQVLVAVGLLKQGFEGIAGAIGGAFDAAVARIIDLINQAIAAYNKLPLAPNIDKIGGSGSGGSASSAENPMEPGFGRTTTMLEGSAGDRAMGRGLVWDEEARAWVYPWQVGSIGAPLQRLSGSQAGQLGGYGPGNPAPAPAAGPVIVQIQGHVYGVDDLIRTIDLALLRANRPALAAR